MLESGDIKDAVHLARIEEKMGGMEKQLAAVIIELKEVTRISNRYATHEESVKRIWEEIDKRDKKWDDRFTKLDGSHENTKERVNKIFWFSSGVSFVGTILVALVLWVLGTEMKKTQTHDERLDRIELHLVSDPLRPYLPR